MPGSTTAEFLPPHPIQPLVRDQQGVIRFKRNAIVAHLLERGAIDLNPSDGPSFADEDREQWAQLTGVTLEEFRKLTYASERVVQSAEAARARKFSPRRPRMPAAEGLILGSLEVAARIPKTVDITVAQARELYLAERDRSGEGAGTWPIGVFSTSGGSTFRIGYTGMVTDVTGGTEREVQVYV